MKLGIFAKTFDGASPIEVLAAARRAGYEAVQYNMACSGLSSMPHAIGGEIASAVGDAAMEASIEIASVSATYNMIHPDRRERERGRESVKAIGAAARRMGARLLTLCTGTCDPQDQWRFHPDNSGEPAWDELCKEFRLLLPVAEEYDLWLGVEPELANVISSARHARRLLDTLKNSRVRIVLDAANLFEIAKIEKQHELIDEAVNLFGDSIALAHAKDRLPDGRFGTAGKGVLDYRYYLAALKRARFDGALIAHGLAANEAPEVAQFLRREMAAVEGRR